MKVSLVHDIDFQCQDLVEALQVFGLSIDDVMANAKINGKIRHHKLCAGREAESQPPIPGSHKDPSALSD